MARGGAVVFDALAPNPPGLPARPSTAADYREYGTDILKLARPCSAPPVRLQLGSGSPGRKRTPRYHFPRHPVSPSRTTNRARQLGSAKTYRDFLYASARADISTLRPKRGGTLKVPPVLAAVPTNTSRSPLTADPRHAALTAAAARHSALKSVIVGPSALKSTAGGHTTFIAADAGCFAAIRRPFLGAPDGRHSGVVAADAERSAQAFEPIQNYRPECAVARQREPSGSPLRRPRCAFAKTSHQPEHALRKAWCTDIGSQIAVIVQGNTFLDCQRDERHRLRTEMKMSELRLRKSGAAVLIQRTWRAKQSRAALNVRKLIRDMGGMRLQEDERAERSHVELEETRGRCDMGTHLFQRSMTLDDVRCLVSQHRAVLARLTSKQYTKGELSAWALDLHAPKALTNLREAFAGARSAPHEDALSSTSSAWMRTRRRETENRRREALKTVHPVPPD